jgi:Na+/H+ antiporter NhaA
MGILRDTLIKDKEKKFWITLAIDIFIILFFIYLALNIKSEYMNGYNDGLKEACKACLFNLTS